MKWGFVEEVFNSRRCAHFFTKKHDYVQVTICGCIVKWDISKQVTLQMAVFMCLCEIFHDFIVSLFRGHVERCPFGNCLAVNVRVRKPSQVLDDIQVTPVYMQHSEEEFHNSWL